MKKLKTFNQVMEGLKKASPEHKRMVETSESLNKLVNQVINERIRQGLSQRDLAKKSGLKQPTIARFETLETLPRISTLVKITNALNLKIHALSEEELRTNQTKLAVDALESLKLSLTFKNIVLGNKDFNIGFDLACKSIEDEISKTINELKGE